MTEHLMEATLPDGTTAEVLTQAQITVLIEIIERELWWHGTRKRLKEMSGWAVAGAGALTMLSIWWPWMDRIMRAVLSGVPGS